MQALLVIRFVTDLTQKYVGWKKHIEGEALPVITAGFFVSISWLPVAIALQIFTTCSTQEYVGQSHDQIQAFSLGQTSPRQNNQYCLKWSYSLCTYYLRLSLIPFKWDKLNCREHGASKNYKMKKKILSAVGFKPTPDMAQCVKVNVYIYINTLNMNRINIIRVCIVVHSVI